MNSYCLLAPLVSLSAFSFALFALDAWTSKLGSRRAGFWLALIGIVVSAALLHTPLASGSLFARQMLIWDGLSYFFSWVTLLTLMFVVLMSSTFKDFEGIRMSAYYGLLLLSAAG